MTMQTAITRGMKRGVRLGMNPTISTYRSVRTPSRRTVETAWQKTGSFIRRAMDREANRGKRA